ncbi:MAG: YfiR family protein [Burkholderiaceae bacterium]
MDILNRHARYPQKSVTIRSLLQSGLLLLACLFSYGVLAQTSAQSTNLELQVKAAYLYKFASYVEWPDRTFSHQDSPLVIGVIGADAVADELEHIVAGHTINGRAIIARKLKRGDPLTGLHMLFIGRLEKAHLLELFSEAKSKPLLTVTESEDAHALGSMINFVVTDDRLRFEVALAPVSVGGLKISARMLTAAYKVTPGAS